MDPDEAITVIERLYPGARLLRWRRLVGGVSADVRALELALPDGQPRTVVLRRHPALDWKPRDRQIARTEFELLRWLHAARVPVPEPLLLEFDGPAPFLVTEFVDGTSVVPDERLDAALDVMAGALARLHALPTDGLPALPERVDPLPELFDYLPDTPANRALHEYLGGCGDSAYRGEPALLHGDFWPENLLWQGGRLAAILDWEDAALGDPLSDVASCRLELTWKYDAAAARRFVDGYARRRPIDPQRLALWQVYVASAGAHFMGNWGLEPGREADMRRKAEAFVQEAAAVLLRTRPQPGGIGHGRHH